MIGELPKPKRKKQQHIFQKHVDGERKKKTKTRTYSIFSMTSINPTPPPTPPTQKEFKSNQLPLPEACDAHLCVWLRIFCLWFAAVSPGRFSRVPLGGGKESSGVGGGCLWQRALSRKDTACWNLKPFRGVVIKVSVLDVLLKWIFHVFHRSPRHFSTVGVCLSLCVCVCECAGVCASVYNGPHGQLCP